MLKDLVEYLPLLNFVFVAVLVPVWNLAKSLKSSKDEVAELRRLNISITEELRILKVIVFQYLPDAASKAYMKEIIKKDKSN